MSNVSVEPAVLIAARDLFFRAKLAGLVAAAGGRAVYREPADVAVLELTSERLAKVARLRAIGIPVIAFGSHIDPDLLRAARDAGANAVPNSRVEETLRAWLAERR